MVAAEYEAIQLYEQLAESTDNCLARKVLLDITNEEKEHVGEFVRLLRELAPEDEAFYREGVEETEEAIAELGESSGCCRHEIACCGGQPDKEECRCSPEEGNEQKTCACEKSNKNS